MATETGFRIGQKVGVNIRGDAGSPTAGVITGIKHRPELTTYEVYFPEYGDGSGVERFYMEEYLTPRE